MTSKCKEPIRITDMSRVEWYRPPNIKMVQMKDGTVWENGTVVLLRKERGHHYHRPVWCAVVDNND